jgi:integration host factor subunit beta
MRHNIDKGEIRSFCYFFVKKYKSCIGRKPKTGEKVKIAPKKPPFFRPGKELKDMNFLLRDEVYLYLKTTG